MPENNKIYPFEECEQYVELLQRNIDRMAGNSASFKNWLIATIAGSLAICFSKDINTETIKILISVLEIITILFYVLDSYYLGIERRMKNAEKLFIAKCKAGETKDVKLLLMSFSQTLEIPEKTPDSCDDMKRRLKEQIKGTLKAMRSLSTLLFYIPMLVILVALKYYLL
ncbi:MAG: hypothetical protein J6P74_03075 [Paludibacteraceae bacterium]|nr:hypothetical protein [Paludibacteraceae bacterium]